MKTWMKVLVCGVLSFAFVFLSVGYAALTDTLQITGNVAVERVVYYTVTYIADGQVFAEDAVTSNTEDYVVRTDGPTNGQSPFKGWVNANGVAAPETIYRTNTMNFTYYATWLGIYTISFIDLDGVLVHSEVYYENTNSISGEGQAIVAQWLEQENSKHPDIVVTWSPYSLTDNKDLLVRPEYTYNGNLKLVPVYEEPDDGIVDYYRVEAVDNLPADVVVPGYVGRTPVKVITRIPNVGGNWYGYDRDVKTITLGEGVETLERNALAYTPELVEVNLPKTLYYMGKNVFSRNDILGIDKKTLTINYNGTMAQWQTVAGRSHEDWANGLKAGTVINCTDGYYQLKNGNWNAYSY